jgi:dephospho-CoA kinase
MMRIIGLTGGIASGKSLVLQQLEQLGMRTIDADEISHEILARDEDVKQAVVDAFGAKVLTRDGLVDRTKLGEIVFQNQECRKVLERILHPLIGAELWKKAREGMDDVVLEAPLLIETGGQERVDLLVVVYATRERQIQRIMSRDGITEEEATRRLDAQLPLARKVSYADYLINNCGSLEDTENQVFRFYHVVSKGERMS